MDDRRQPPTRFPARLEKAGKNRPLRSPDVCGSAVPVIHAAIDVALRELHGNPVQPEANAAARPRRVHLRGTSRRIHSRSRRLLFPTSAFTSSGSSVMGVFCRSRVANQAYGGSPMTNRETDRKGQRFFTRRLASQLRYRRTRNAGMGHGSVDCACHALGGRIAEGKSAAWHRAGRAREK